MKSFLKKALARLFHPIAVRIGYQKKATATETKNSGKNELLNNFYESLNRINFDVQHIVDIGANHGSWTRQALKYFPNAYFTLLEPQSWMKEDIQDLLSVNNKISFYGVGAGEKEGSFKFTIVERDDSCSFRFSQEEATVNGYKQIDIPVVTLNSLLSDPNIPIPDIIKIDAEGLDIEVLKGSSNFYGKSEVFMVREAGVMVPGLKNSVLNIVNFMDGIGYKLYDITDLNRTIKNNALWLSRISFCQEEWNYWK